MSASAPQQEVQLASERDRYGRWMPGITGNASGRPSEPMSRARAKTSPHIESYIDELNGLAFRSEKDEVRYKSLVFLLHLSGVKVSGSTDIPNEIKDLNPQTLTGPQLHAMLSLVRSVQEQEKGRVVVDGQHSKGEENV